MNGGRLQVLKTSYPPGVAVSKQPVGTGRRLRYRLRSLLVLIAVAAVCVGFVERYVAARRVQQSVAAEIERLGGYVRWEVCDPGPAWLVNLLGADFFAEVYLVECDSSPVGDDTLVQLAKLGRLEWLLLDSDRITDQGLRRIAGLSQLVRLDLSSRQITDDGLDSLARLSNLRWLALRRTRITLAGMERFRLALPNCQVQWDGPAGPSSPSAAPAESPATSGTDLAASGSFSRRPLW
jgi:hypothetical protein